MPDARTWMRANLTTQGYCLDDGARRELWLGLRFSTGLCLSLVVGALLAAGVPTLALILGGLLVAACATVTVANLCLPSEALAWWDRRSTRKRVAVT